MEPQTRSETGAGSTGGTGVRWDASRLEDHSCTLAAVRNEAGRVVLSFGANPRDEGAQAVRLLRRVALPPLAARHLMDMLQRLVAEHDTYLQRPK